MFENNLSCRAKVFVDKSNSYMVEFSKCNRIGHNFLSYALKNSMSSDLYCDGTEFHLFGHLFSISHYKDKEMLSCVFESYGTHMEFDNVDSVVVVYYPNRAEIWGYLKDECSFMLCLEPAI